MLRQRQLSAWLNERQPRACLWPRKRESLVASLEPAETRRSLSAQLLTVVSLAADAFRKRQFAVRAPGEQPGLHVVVPDIVACFEMALRLPNLGQHAFLISNVRLDRIRDEEICAAAGSFRQPHQTPFSLRSQADTEGDTSCVRHEHIIIRFLLPRSSRFLRNGMCYACGHGRPANDQ